MWLMKKETICSMPQEQHERYRRHFSKVLNILSQFDEDELMKARQRPERSHLADPPSKDELEEAIGKMKILEGSRSVWYPSRNGQGPQL